MTAHELVSTMEAARTSWRLTTARYLSRRQLLFIADILRATLLEERRDRNPTQFDSCAQELPPLVPVRSTSTLFGVGVPVMSVGPIPQPLDAARNPAFTFVGVPGREKLSIVTPTGVFYRQNGSRQSANRPCAMWLSDSAELLFQETLVPLTPKRRVQGVFLHPMEAKWYTPPGTVPKLVENPLAFEYPLSGRLIRYLLEMAAKHEQVTSLLPPHLQNDDQPAHTAEGGR